MAGQGPLEADYALGPSGLDHVHFMLGAGPGEPLRPLAAVASGGESARIMLAVKAAPALMTNEPGQTQDNLTGMWQVSKLWNDSQNIWKGYQHSVPQIQTFVVLFVVFNSPCTGFGYVVLSQVFLRGCSRFCCSSWVLVSP